MELLLVFSMTWDLVAMLICVSSKRVVLIFSDHTLWLMRRARGVYCILKIFTEHCLSISVHN